MAQAVRCRPKSGLYQRPVHVGIMIDKTALGQIFFLIYFIAPVTFVSSMHLSRISFFSHRPLAIESVIN